MVRKILSVLYRHKIKTFLILWLLISGLISPAHSAQCIIQDVNGYFVPVAQTIEQCSGFVVLEPQEYSEVPTLTALFAWPEDTQPLSDAFEFAFVSVIWLYLIVYGYGVIINFVNNRN